MMYQDSPIIRVVIGLLNPLMLLVAFYLILNGHTSPGGGFQGGAILATVFISHYVIYPYEDIRIRTLQFMEKILYLALVLLSVLVVIVLPVQLSLWQNQLYMTIMNILIGFKVGSGLTLIFLRFVFHEGGL